MCRQCGMVSERPDQYSVEHHDLVACYAMELQLDMGISPLDSGYCRGGVTLAGERFTVATPRSHPVKENA